jgi:hypothetical protein
MRYRSYGPPIHVRGRGDERDDDQRDGLSPWAHVSQQRWEYNLWQEGFDTPAEWDRGLALVQTWETKQVRALGLTDALWDPAEACPFCSQPGDAPPPSGVRLRWKPTPASRSTRNRPTLRLV